MENQIKQTNDVKPVAEEQVIEPTVQANELTIDQDKLNLYMEKLGLEQNLPFAIISGIAAALVAAVLWAVVTVATQYQIGFMAIVVGLMVGYTIRYTGKGIDKTFGIIGAALALFGCVLGNFLSLIGFFANAEGLGYMEAMGMIDFALVPEIMIETFNPMDLLFYGLAVYEGYQFSFRKITEQEIVQNAV